ncbi:hypothetical protein DPX16_21520 [Anabarilius grahami]|uniref:Uncharacterized protein n=1 Tax=Anabarilius grahami TaxID=495550 RepID=A0A3N0XUM5_ANAGA|nr:hypothetical protein DPX16_21520 [Anabarilius grahami]
MGLFILSELSTPPLPPTATSAAERLIGLFQVGRSLERYVEEFVELAYLTNWSVARLIALFLDGLDESTIRFDEPDDYVSIPDTINLILYLNGSKFVVEEVQDSKCSSRPVPPETRAAWPVRQPPSSSTYPSSELFTCILPDSIPSESGRSKRRKRKKSKPSPVSAEPSAISAEPSPVSAEPSPVPIGILVVYEGMDWTPLPAAAAEPSAPAAAAEPASPVSAEPVSPVSAEPLSPVSAKPVSPVSAEPAPACHEPTPAHKSTPFLKLFKLLLSPLKYFFIPVGGEHVGGVSAAPDLPWPPKDTDPPGPPTAPDPPWPAKAPDPPWPAKAPDPPWLMDSPWRPLFQSAPLPAPA